MLQGVIQLNSKIRVIKTPFKQHLLFLINILSNMESNKPLYSFTLPGLILGTIGLYMSINSVQDSYFNENFDNIKNMILVFLLVLVGTTMTFMGFLLHSIAGLIKYKANET